MSTKLQDHIDAPIQKSIVGLALLGFTPVFSCCGFKYKGQDETPDVPKKFHFAFPPKPYIFLSIFEMQPNLKALLVDIAFAARWKMAFVGAGPSAFIDLYFEGGFDPRHPWGQEGCIHRNEPEVLALKGLEETIQNYSKYFKDTAIVRDGNAIYKTDKGIKHWQYDPSPDWVVTKETFNSL